MRARYYDTKNGRFDQRDSYMGQHGTPLSENRYMYVWNNPNKYIDPSGHKLAIEGADPGMEDAINKADRQHERYLRGEITKQEFIDLVGDVWTQYNLDYPEHAVDVGQTTESAGELADSEYAKNQAEAAKAAKAAAQQAVIDDLMNELTNQRNLNIPDLSGLSREEQIRILREIKKICDEIEGKYGKWDEAARDEAQKKVEEITQRKCNPPRQANKPWWEQAWDWFGENWTLVVAGLLIAASVILLALTAIVSIPALAVAAGVTVSATAVGAAGGALAVTGLITVIGSEVAYSHGLLSDKQRTQLAIGGFVALFSGSAVYLITKGNTEIPSPIANDLEQLGVNKWNHILQIKHNWSKLVDNPTTDSVKGIIQKVLEKGEVVKYGEEKDVYKSVHTVNGYVVEVTYIIIDGIRRISDGWVVG